MARRRSNRVGRSKPNKHGVPTVIEIHEDPFSKHRTCWMHVAAYLRDRKKKIPKKEIAIIQQNAPCFYDTISHGQRSQRRVGCKYRVSKLGKKLDDRAFMGYLETLWKRFSIAWKTPFTYLDCLWFDNYRKGRAEVLKWIKNQQIFSKKYVFVPIVCLSHWNLLIFCNFGKSFNSKTEGPCMLLLDSLHKADPWRLEPDIRKFVVDVYKTEGRKESQSLVSKIPLLVPKVPQQRNDVECGRFVLYYIYLFMRDAPKNFSFEGYPYFMENNWFGAECLEEFCASLDSLAGIQ